MQIHACFITIQGSKCTTNIYRSQSHAEMWFEKSGDELQNKLNGMISQSLSFKREVTHISFRLHILFRKKNIWF